MSLGLNSYTNTRVRCIESAMSFTCAPPTTHLLPKKRAALPGCMFTASDRFLSLTVKISSQKLAVRTRRRRRCCCCVEARRSIGKRYGVYLRRSPARRTAQGTAGPGNTRCVMRRVRVARHPKHCISGSHQARHAVAPYAPRASQWNRGFGSRWVRYPQNPPRVHQHMRHGFCDILHVRWCRDGVGTHL